MTAPFRLPYGLKSVATAYASFMGTSLSAYMDLLGHHIGSTLDLIAAPSASTRSEETSSEDDPWVGADFSRLSDPATLFRFLEVSDYCFGYSDSDEGGHDPSRES